MSDNLSGEERAALLKVIPVLARLAHPPATPEPEPKPKLGPKPGPTRAEIIDAYFSKQNYFPGVPYQPIGELIVDICENHTGSDPLWVSTMAACCEQEGGGKNVHGCDAASLERDCNKPVSKASVQRLIDHYQKTGVSNGIGPMQITWFPFIQKAENMGGAHILRNSMTVGANYLNDLLNRYGYLNALEAYNDGNPRFNDPNNPYEVQFAAKHVAWRERLRGASDHRNNDDPKPGQPEKPKPQPPGEAKAPLGWDPVNGKLSPPGFVAQRPQPHSIRYDLRNPTRFIFREDVEEVVRNLYREFGKYRIFVNTYVNHPEEADPHRPDVSFDVWGGGGDRPGWRGLWLPAEIGAEVFDALFHDPNPPDLRWCIYHRKIYGVWSGFAPAPFGDGSRFSNHDDHGHYTYDGPFVQIK